LQPTQSPLVRLMSVDAYENLATDETRPFKNSRSAFGRMGSA
jgi:hypothetical protein